MNLDVPIQHTAEVFNLLEGLLWLGIAVGFATAFCKTRSNVDLKAGAAVLFLTFGLSDFIEIQTGAWYRPWWLLAWKASNLVSLIIVYMLYRRRTE